MCSSRAENRFARCKHTDLPCKPTTRVSSPPTPGQQLAKHYETAKYADAEQTPRDENLHAALQNRPQGLPRGAWGASGRGQQGCAERGGREGACLEEHTSQLSQPRVTWMLLCAKAENRESRHAQSIRAHDTPLLSRSNTTAATAARGKSAVSRREIFLAAAATSACAFALSSCKRTVCLHVPACP